MRDITQRTARLTPLYLLILVLMPIAEAAAQTKTNSYKNADFDLTGASVTYHTALDLIVFEQRVSGRAGATTPTPHGGLDGAPVLGYVFPTTLAPTAIGFGTTEGIVTLAVTSHPDFDDTPLWDENGDGNYGNDGVRWHTHWVLLTKDTRVPGGLSVKEFKKADAVVLPPTNPGMPMYMDSPGHAVVTQGNTLKVLVPAQRLRGSTTFKYDAVTCYMQVSAGKDAHQRDAAKPMLGVYEVFEILSGNLGLPYEVVRQ